MTKEHQNRQQFITNVFEKCFGDKMEADPAAWRKKFRKMSASAFAFYRGSAAVFYTDMEQQSDSDFLNKETSRVWIHGDLHACNFGTYMNSEGIIVFDINDFDEAFVGPFMWDLKRLSASLMLLGYEKALSDDDIKSIIQQFARSYAQQVKNFSEGESSSTFALTLDNTDGPLKEVLLNARLSSRLDVLDMVSEIRDYDRHFKNDAINHKIDAKTKKKVISSFKKYLKTIPENKRQAEVNYIVKDVVETKGVGIGSAGNCDFTIIWSVGSQRWEIYLNGENLLHHNSAASVPNPPDLTLGSWNNVSGCSDITTLSGDVQSTLGGALPVELTNFHVSEMEKAAKLSWQTASPTKSNTSIEKTKLQKMQTIIVKNTPEEVLRARSWWQSLESQWKMAFNEGLFGVGPTLEPPKDEYLILMLTRVDKIRLTRPLAAHPNLSFRLTNLSAIEGLPNLNFLTVANCGIESLRPLAKHQKLEFLFLNNNRIKNLAGLENLTNLKELYLNANEITDLKPLKKLTNLRTLYVNYNKLVSLSGIHEGHAKKLRNFYVEPNEDLPHREIIRMQMECGIICRKG